MDSKQHCFVKVGNDGNIRMLANDARCGAYSVVLTCPSGRIVGASWDFYKRKQVSHHLQPSPRALFSSWSGSSFDG